jgi:hypothetical protein
MLYICLLRQQFGWFGIAGGVWRRVTAKLTEAELLSAVLAHPLFPINNVTVRKPARTVTVSDICTVSHFFHNTIDTGLFSMANFGA